jgi:light-regulated signal transduction histidine kinase (bacteriophytochrome)
MAAEPIMEIEAERETQPPELKALYRTLTAMNEELTLGVLRQHELTEAAELSNIQLQLEICERKKAEEENQRLNVELERRVAERTAQLEEANQELEAFSYSVSHDLRAPLRHVMGFVNLLLKDAGPTLSEKSRGHLGTVSQSAKRMGDLIDDLLAFSRIGRSEIKKTDVDLNQAVREVLDDFQTEIKTRKISVEIHPLPSVWADYALLRQALVNLISNAVKFTGGRAEPKIEIGCAPGAPGENVVFIRDNGAGFDPQYVGKLFGVFQRLHSQAEFEGTGIGLANVQRIIHRHGGRIRAEGVVDGGATFYFSLPLRNGGSDERPSQGGNEVVDHNGPVALLEKKRA